MPTIQESLAHAANSLTSVSDSPLLDAEVLLCYVLTKNRSYLRTWPEQHINADQHQRFQQLCQQRQQGHPIAYLTQQREFWSRDFFVNPTVLIPRPDTELLIELSLPLIPSDQAFRVLDLGTGSGVIAITLAAERRNAQLIAADVSLEALRVAQQNAAHHQINNISFYHSDWFTALPNQQFQLIVSNPPYIDANDYHLKQGDVRFEPESALIADNHGLSDIQTIAQNARQWLSTGGHLLIEHGYDQGDAVRNIFAANKFQNIQTYRDLSDQARVTGGEA